MIETSILYGIGIVKTDFLLGDNILRIDSIYGIC